MSIDGLIKALKVDPNLEASTETLLPFVDGPEFFRDWLTISHAKNSKLIVFKREYYANENDLLTLIETRKEQFIQYIESTCSTLDDVGENVALAKALGLSDQNVETIAKSLVDNNYVNNLIPDNHVIHIQGRRISHYFNSKIVGKDVAEKNLRKYIRKKYRNLDEITRNLHLCRALGLTSTNTRSMARECIERGIFERELPDDHEIKKIGTGNRASYYVDPWIVGEEWTAKNLKKYVQKNYPKLEEIKHDHTLAFAFGEKYYNWRALAAKCVQNGFVSAELSDDVSFDEGIAPYRRYFDKEIAGISQLKKNIQKYVDAVYDTLDDVLKNPVLSSALDCDNYNLKSLVTALVNQGFISPELPDNHPISKSRGHISWFFVSDVVGENQALKNLKKYIQANYTCIEDVKYNYALNSAFGIGKRSVDACRKKILELGWLNSNAFRSYAEHNLPIEFRLDKIAKKSRSMVLKKTIGAYNRQKNGTTTFPKGEALEQLFGLAASYANPAQLAIPQYCLDVGVKKGKGHFRTRVDFKVGNIVYEVKWGKATENIRQTYHKHTKLLTRLENSSLEYHLVTLDEADSIDIPHESFGNFLESYLSPDLKDKFEALTALLMEVSDERTDLQSVDFLIHFRDYVYNLVDKANNKQGDERKSFIEKNIETLYELANENTKQMDDYMKEHSNRFFAPLEAHFEWDGKLYRGFITPPELQKEDPERYETRYYFGDVEFTNELDRNIAILIECSPQVSRVEGTLDKPKRLQREPVFRLPNGMDISTRGQPDVTRVRSLRKLKDLVGVPDDLYAFARDYIRENGLRC